MYEHQSQSLVLHQQHAHRTATPQSGTSHSETSSSAATATSTRPMRAGSCSSVSTANTPADAIMAAASSTYDPDGSGSPHSTSSPELSNAATAGPAMSSSFDRKRKCDALDRLPSTPRHSTSSPSPAQLSPPRPRSATCSSNLLSPSVPATSRHHRLRTSSSSTASCSDACEDQGNQPKGISRSSWSSSRQCRRSPSPSSSKASASSSSLSPLPASSLSLRRRSLQGTSGEMAKRPKLESAASTGHLHVPGDIYASHIPSPLDLSNQLDQDMPSAPPSASFSNLTITQPPSPAYAAFSIQTPTPAHIPSSTSPTQFAFAQSSMQAVQETSQTTSRQAEQQQSLIPSPSTTMTSQTSQSRTSIRATARRREKSPARPVRRRFRRATSLPLDDEITLAHSQLVQHHKRSNSSLSSSSSTLNASHRTTTNLMNTEQMSDNQDLTAETDGHVRGRQDVQRRLAGSECTQASQVTASNMTSAEVKSGSTTHISTIGGTDQREGDACSSQGTSRTEQHPLSVQEPVAPVLLTPAQLAAMHQFNMPRAPRPAHPITYMSRATLPPFPSRTQAYAQAQRRLPIPIPGQGLSTIGDIVHPSVAYRPGLLYIQPTAQPPSLPEQRRQQPTASIPAYMPPIARETLKELDLQEILQCRQLRHDVVFDANLMFRPNFDGDRGDRKREAADRYWSAITRELETGCKCTAYSFAPSATARMMGKPSLPLPCICRNAGDPRCRTSVSERLPSRIVPLIQELRDIILALLPSSGTTDAQGQETPTRRTAKSSDSAGSATAQMIIDTLDPMFIAQEVAHGVLDVSSLAKFFGHILKSHCAPMRDEIVESMVQTIHRGGQTNDMPIVASGLRMCFEILELMKLDIANHQLRMLRPYLLETSADFEYKTFLHLREKKVHSETTPSEMDEQPEGPPLSKTRAWLSATGGRLAVTAATQTIPRADLHSAIVDGVLELLFKPSDAAEEPLPAEKASRGRQPSSMERQRKLKVQALPLSSEIPETLHLDSYRLQLFHGDIVDLCIVHLLLLLYRQLCSANKRIPSHEDIEGIRRQIWVIMSEINANAAVTPTTAGRRSASPLPQSVKKLESERWRQGMRDVLLQISRFSESSSSANDLGRTSGVENLYVPDSSTLELLNGWMDNNFKVESKLFQLVQTRLRKALAGLMLHELQRQSLWPAHKSWDMASTDLSPEAYPETDAVIKQNGLSDLASEVRLLAWRISKVAGYNAHVYRELYVNML